MKSYNITHTLSHKKHIRGHPVKNVDGITIENDQLIRWEGYFREALHNIREEIEEEEQTTESLEGGRIHTNESSKEEMIAALNVLQFRKTPGIDKIFAEILKRDLDISVEVFYPLFSCFW